MFRAFAAASRPAFKSNTKLTNFAPIFATKRYKSTKQPKLFDKILIANRGEIACRVIKTAHKLGIKTVAVYSEADAKSLHVQMADEAYLIGPPAAKDSYLLGQKIIDVAKATGAQAIHPGYGFLSENAGFAQLCAQQDVVFIGPPASAISAMGSKSESKRLMENAKVPVVPGYHGEDQSDAVLLAEAKRIGFPVLIKAVLGGGGKGMKIVEKEEDFLAALQSARRESLASFSDDRVLIEKYLTRPRHIEIQVFADTHGNTVYLFERDCSVQRRHQKVLEEAPAPGLTPELRRKMGESAVDAARAVGYVGAGTVEFIVDASASTSEMTYYFMEMNTRLQVEHPVTEMITNQDLVEWQLRVASGFELPLRQEDLNIHGHSIEARIYAENPANNFMPGTGTLELLRTPPASEHVRIETGVRQGDEVSIYYDPMIAKLVVWGPNRDSALRKLKLCLEQYNIVGLHTNIDFLQRIIVHPSFVAGEVETNFIPKYESDLFPEKAAHHTDHTSNNSGYILASLSRIFSEQYDVVNSAAASQDPHSPFNTLAGKRLNNQLTRTLTFLDAAKKHVPVTITYLDNGSYTMKVHNHEYTVSGICNKCCTNSGGVRELDITAFVNNTRYNVTAVDKHETIHVFANDASHTLEMPVLTFGEALDDQNNLFSPMPGKIIEVLAQPGQAVKQGTPLITLVAMKIEFTIRAPRDGVVEKIMFKAGDIVKEKQLLIHLAAESA